MGAGNQAGFSKRTLPTLLGSNLFLHPLVPWMTPFHLEEATLSFSNTALGFSPLSFPLCLIPPRSSWASQFRVSPNTLPGAILTMSIVTWPLFTHQSTNIYWATTVRIMLAPGTRDGVRWEPWWSGFSSLLSGSIVSKEEGWKRISQEKCRRKKKLNDDECYEEKSKLEKVGSDFSSSGQGRFPREGNIWVVTWHIGSHRPIPERGRAC